MTEAHHLTYNWRRGSFDEALELLDGGLHQATVAEGAAFVAPHNEDEQVDPQNIFLSALYRKLIKDPLAPGYHFTTRQDFEVVKSAVKKVFVTSSLDASRVDKPVAVGRDLVLPADRTAMLLNGIGGLTAGEVGIQKEPSVAENSEQPAGDSVFGWLPIEPEMPQPQQARIEACEGCPFVGQVKNLSCETAVVRDPKLAEGDIAVRFEEPTGDSVHRTGEVILGSYGVDEDRAVAWVMGSIGVCATSSKGPLESRQLWGLKGTAYACGALHTLSKKGKLRPKTRILKVSDAPPTT